MPLKKKIFSLIFSLNLFVAIFLLIAGGAKLSSAFLDFERVNMAKSLRVIKSSVEVGYETLDTITRDYASWDDTYYYAENLNQDYIDTNFVVDTFVNLKVDLAIVLNTGGQIKYKQQYNLETEESVEISSDLISKIQYSDKFVEVSRNQTPLSGLLRTNKGILEFSAQPILTSSYEGPSHGVLILGRFITDASLEPIRKASLLDFKVYPVGSLPEYLSAYYYSHLSKQDTYVFTSGLSNITGLLVIKDVFNEDALVVDITAPLYVVQAGRISLLQLSVLYIFALAVSLIILLISMDILVFRPLRAVVAETLRLKKKGDFSDRIKVKSSGEIQVLIDTLNEMLERLQDNEHLVLEAHKVLKEKTEQVEGKAKEMDRINQHIVGREVRMSELKQEIDTLKSRLGETHAK